MFKRSQGLLRSWLELNCLSALWKCCSSLRSPVVLSLRVVLPIVVLSLALWSPILCMCILVFKQTLRLTFMQISRALFLYIFPFLVFCFSNCSLLPEFQCILSAAKLLCSAWVLPLCVSVPTVPYAKSWGICGTHLICFLPLRDHSPCCLLFNFWRCLFYILCLFKKKFIAGELVWYQLFHHRPTAFFSIKFFICFGFWLA